MSQRMALLGIATFATLAPLEAGTGKVEKKLTAMLAKAEQKVVEQEAKAATLGVKIEALEAAIAEATDPAVQAALAAKLAAKEAKREAAQQKAAKKALAAAVLDEKLAALAAPFVYASWADAAVRVEVRGPDGSPVPYARVVVTDVMTPPKKDQPIEERVVGREYFVGLTGADGVAIATARIPSAAAAVDVVVHAPGLVGPYTHEALRAAAGPFAVSSRVTTTRGGLAALEVQLAAAEVES